jgi:hypothetical protein
MLKLTIGNSISSGGTKAPVIVYDVDAQAYFTALANDGVTLTKGEKGAYNNLVIRMKGLDPAYANFGDNQIWTSNRGLYPYIGSSLAGFRYNGKFPTSVTQQVDGGSYPISPGYQFIAGGVTVDSIYGAKGNGINGVILTNLNWVSGQGSALVPTSLSMGCVYKNTSALGRDDFGDYNPFVNESGIWLRTKPNPANARLSCLEGAGITGNYVVGGKGHWMLHRSGDTKRVYYQGNLLTYPSGQNRVGKGNATFGGLFTWTFLGLNFSAFQYVNGVQFADAATRAGRCVNFSSNTLMLSYISTAFSSTLIPVWNNIVEAFCVETGKKTW